MPRVIITIPDNDDCFYMERADKAINAGDLYDNQVLAEIPNSFFKEYERTMNRYDKHQRKMLDLFVEAKGTGRVRRYE